RRLVHLAEDHRSLLDNAGVGHLEVKVVPFTGTFTDTREHGNTAVLLCDVVDEFLDEDRLADARSAEEADLTALDVRSEKVNDFDACFKDFDISCQFLEFRRIAVDG